MKAKQMAKKVAKKVAKQVAKKPVKTVTKKLVRKVVKSAKPKIVLLPHLKERWPRTLAERKARARRRSWRRVAGRRIGPRRW